MVLEIATIQDVKLCKLANKIDNKSNKDGVIDKNEIGKLLTLMVKKKYESESINELLGVYTNNLSEEDKLFVYQKAQEELKNSLKVAESFVETENKQNRDCGKELLKLSGIGAIIGAVLKINPANALSLKSVLKGCLSGSVVGLGLAAGALIADKALNNNFKAKCETKNEVLNNIQTEIDKLNNKNNIEEAKNN